MILTKSASCPIASALFLFFIACAQAGAQTNPIGRLDYLKSKDSSFALFANTSNTWSTSDTHYPNELILLTGLPSKPTISARIDLLGAVNLCPGCGGLRNVAISPDGDTALVSSEPSDFQPPNTRTVSALFLLRNLKAFAMSKNAADLQIRTFKASDFPQLDNVSGLAFGPDGTWAVANTGAAGYLDLTYSTEKGAVVLITGLPDRPVFSPPFPVPMHSLGNIDLSLDGGTLLLNDTNDFSGTGEQKADQVIVRGIRPDNGNQPKVVSIATQTKPALDPDGPPVVRDARLTLDGRFVIAPIGLIQSFDLKSGLPIPANQIAILGPVRNGALDTVRLLTAGDGVTGGPYHAGISPDGDSALIGNALDSGGATLLTGLMSGEPASIKASPLPFPFFGPPFPLGPNGPPVLAPHGQVIYTPDADSALVVNFITPPLASLPLTPSLSVLTGFQSGNIRVAATLSDPTFNPFDNRQQVATAPAGLLDYVNLYFPAGSKRDGMAFLINAAIEAADRDLASNAADLLANFIESAFDYVGDGVLKGNQAGVLATLATAAIQTLLNPTENSPAADLRSNYVSPDSIAFLRGSGLIMSPAMAGAGPLPTNLGGASVTIIDSLGVERRAPLYAVGTGAIEYVVPAGTATGRAIALVSGGASAQFPNDTHVLAAGIVDVERVSPALFDGAANLPSALLVRTSADGSQRVETVTGTINLGSPTDQVFLILFGSGIRGRSTLSAVTATAGGQQLPVSYAGPQSDFSGMDQVNLLLPRSLGGAGKVQIALSIDGWDANKVTINIQ